MPKIVADKIDWIKLGFKLFARHGASGIVVDKIAKKLKCNRSSFYWHFSSKEKFIDEILGYWIDKDTEQIMAQTGKVDSPEEKFKILVENAFKFDPDVDFIFHLKRYAIGRKDIQKTIDHIDAKRMDFVAALLIALGHSEEEAKMRAKLFYKYLIGYHEMIMHKKQNSNYVEEVYAELKYFIKL